MRTSNSLGEAGCDKMPDETFEHLKKSMDRCEWCRDACTQASPQCQMMAGYAEAQMRERLAYANRTCSLHRTLDDRIVALALTRQESTKTFQAMKERRR